LFNFGSPLMLIVCLIESCALCVLDCLPMLVLAKEAELAKFTDPRADIALATPTAWSWLLSALDYRSLTQFRPHKLWGSTNASHSLGFCSRTSLRKFCRMSFSIISTWSLQ